MSRVCLVVCDQWLGSNGYAGARALRRAGWSVEIVPEWEFVPARWHTLSMRIVSRLLRGRAIEEFGAALVRAAERVRPEFILVFKGTFTPASALRSLRRLGVKSYCFYPDNSFFAHGPRIPRALSEYDWVYTAKSFGLADMASSLGVTRASVLLHGFDPELHYPRLLSASEESCYGCDVSFIGTWSPKKAAFLAHLARARPALKLRVWGAQWHRERAPSPLRHCIMGRAAEGAEYPKAICASRINLGILSERRKGSSADDQITSRTFHIPACGGFMLHEGTDEVLALFEKDRHIGTFRTPEELVSEVDRYLAEDEARAACASAAHTLVVNRDSWDARIAHILDRHQAVVSGH